MRKTILLFVTTLLTFGALAEPPRDGQFRAKGATEVWSDTHNKWVSPEKFWLAYAKSQGGLTWGERHDYPPYNDVKEHDTMIIVVKSGSCLMEFFHSRWRRANDVRRWDPSFNEYGGCPNVFD